MKASCLDIGAYSLAFGKGPGSVLVSMGNDTLSQRSLWDILFGFVKNERAER